MKQTAKRGLALLTAFVLVFSLMPQIHHHTAHAASTAADVDYVTSGNYIYNWGTRGETATFLSSKAEAFYTGNDTYDVLSQLAGGSSTSNAPDSALYDALQDLMVSRHTYVTSYDDTRPLFQYTDCENSAKTSNKISSFYSGTPVGPAWDEGATWNREHTWPNSKGDASGNGENDIMMLRPASTTENSGRGNKAYGTTTDADFYYPNGESNDQYDVRGDVARILLYVYVRWGNTGSMWGSAGVIESLDVLLDWMEADPVDTWEMGRNDSVEAITGTRNVFVDYPEFAFLLFGAEMPANISTPSGKASTTVVCQHNYVAGQVVAPTCTAEGYTVYTCSLCSGSYRGDKTPVIDHIYVNGSCSGCGKAEPVALVAINAPAAGTAYKFGMVQKNFSATDVYYLTGAMSGYYMGTTTDASTAIDVYLEATAGGYHFYTMLDGVKTYINMVVNNSFVNGSYDAAASTVYTFDAVSGTLIAEVNGSSYRFGTTKNGNYTTVGPYAVSADIFYCQFYAEADSDCQHTSTTQIGAVAVTCTEDGHTGKTVCNDCGQIISEGEVIVTPGSHDYQNGACSRCGKAEPQMPSVTKEVTLSFADTANRTVFETTQQVWVQNGITFTNNKESSNNIADYSNPVRLYKNSSVTVEYPSMTKIVFTCNSSDYATALQTSIGTISGVTVTVSGSDVTVAFAEVQDSFMIAALSAQVRMNSITVTAAVEEGACKHTNTTVEGAVAATCTQSGRTGKTVCSDCGETVSADSVAPALGHDYVAGICSRCGEEEPNTTEATLSFASTANRTVFDTNQQVWVQNGITFTNNKESSNNIGDYSNPVRLYAKSSVTVEHPDMLKIVFTCNSGSYATVLQNSIGTVDGATVTLNGSAVTVEFAAAQDSFVIASLSGQTRLNSITVTAVASEKPDCAHANTAIEGAADATCTAAGHTGKTVCSDCGETTDAGSAIPALGHDYVAGACSRCGKAEPVETTVTLVTNVSQLLAGKKIIIAAKDFNYALSTTQNNNNRGRIAITKSADGSTVTFMDDAGVQIITLEAGTKDGTFAFNVDNGYLYAASTGSNHLKTETTLSDNSSWLITITDGVASVVAQGTNTRNILRYNDGNGIFSCYGSGQLDIAIYMIDNGEPNPDPTPDPEPGCAHANTTIEGAADATCTAAGHTGKTVCSDCGETTDAGSAIPALGHDYVDNVCSRCGAEKPNLAVVTIDLTTTDNRTVYNAEQQIWKQNGITVTNDKAASTTDVGDYAPARFYKSSKLTIAYPGMTQIVFNCNNYKTTYAADLVTSIGTMDGVTATADGAVVTVVFAAACDSFVIEQLAAQIRMDSITVTGAVIESSCAHANTTTEGAADATCTAAGHTGKTVCSDCGETIDAGSAIPALGHDYVDGICSRCGDKNCVLSVIESPVAGTAYKFGMVQENVSATDVYYLTGEMAGYYMDTVTDKAAAIDVYLESTTGGYYLYTMIGGVKTYINMVVNDTYVNGAYEAAASTVYAFDATSKTIVAEVNGSTYWFGTRNDKTFTTVGPCDVSYNGFYCQFYGEVTGDVTPECQHTNTTIEGAADATCTAAGHTGKTVCSDCGETLDAGSAIPALGHDYVDGVCSRCGETEPAADPEVEGVTIDLTNMDNRTVYNAEQQVWKQNGITVTNDKAASTTDVGDYAPARFYKGSKLTVAYPGMTQIVFNCNDYKDTYASTLEESIGTVDGVTVTVDGAVVTVAFAAARDSFVIEQLTAQVRVNSIIVAAASEETPCEHANTSVEGAADATCTAAGHTGKTVCSDCGETVSEGSVIPALGHDYVGGVCSRCGDTVTPVVPVPTPKPDPKPQPQPQPKPEPDPEPEQKPEQDIDSSEVFEDLSEDNWYYDAVDYMIDNGLMNGVSKNEFAPEENLSRAMMWTILARLSGENTEGGATWYEKGRQWAMETGITDGADSNGEITREQLVVMLWRFMGEPAVSSDLTSYTDTDSVSNWAEEAMAWAIEVGLINGVTPTTLAPKNLATRAQVATILWRFCENILKD